ncbi:SMC-Scp complex subunit ScpB [Gehongia tenuis]|uniref:Segregation and condensation protein B n=1 Tax=Gehongia tenuis TaxID=2763655 RepID=A0A926D3P9_9FIRM|nr:SMC-Scp complex subunit ScpB [Gehongia tenuis]MBC8531188.1 SMC-Scp complex subunit ScpB [Gehongia tenuis]
MNLDSAMEALLFVSGNPLTLEDLAQALDVSMLEITAAAQHLQQNYETRQSGLRVLIFEDKVQLATRPEYGEVIERWLTPQKRQALSQSAMETLSIIAYRQPITRADVEAIRGVKCEYALSVLQRHNLVMAVGRKDTLGRPVLYGTTDDFLRYFNLRTLEDLPGREELIKAPGETPILEEPPEEEPELA